MDAVITYVNLDDSEWVNELLKVKPDFKLSSSYRYKDYGTLKFLLRGIESYMPFIKNVFIVVSNESLIPKWVNKNNVHIILHKDIIPAKFLPTFNSCTIEMFLHNIKELDEKFIYFNDDMIPWYPLEETDFFQDNKIVTLILEQRRSKERMFHYHLYNTTQAAYKAAEIEGDPNIMFRAEHSTTAMLKSVNQLVYNKIQNIIHKSLRLFRTADNITLYLSLYYNYITGNTIKRETPILLYLNTNKNDTLNTLKNGITRKIVCLNDDGMPYDTWDIDLLRTFHNKFPKPSKYEIIPKVDYVIPFVDFSDDIWRKQYNKYATVEKNWSNNDSRYRDWDILKYQLRSIEKNMPWINNIYIIVSITPTLVPNWLNTYNDKIHIVMDSDIVPHEYLPTFNSNTIDLFIPNIPTLSEYYIYACDDYVITKPLAISDFYSEDYKVRQYISIFYVNPEHPYTASICNSNRFIPEIDDIKQNIIIEKNIPNKENRILEFKTNHGLVPHITAENRKFLKDNYNAICNTLTLFRSNKNVTWLIYSLNLFNNKKLLRDRHLKVLKNNLKTLSQIKKVDPYNYQVLVLNDDYTEDFELGKKTLIDILNKILPDKSSFEK